MIETRSTSIALKGLYSTQRSVEKLRIALSNRVSAIDRDVDRQAEEIEALYARLSAAMNGWEEEIEQAMHREVRKFPVWDHWLGHVKGIGPQLGAPLLSLLLPPLPDCGPSTWYRAAGLYAEARCQACGHLLSVPEPPDDPEYKTPPVCKCAEKSGGLIMHMPRARAGEGAITYHAWLRRCLFLVATSFVRVGGYYRTVYERQKERLASIHAGEAAWPNGRLDSVARWATVKLFLAHLYEKWLEAEGLGTGRRAYVIEKLGHHYTPPPEPNGSGKI